ncbi:RNA-binding protein 5-B [Nibea albiflora]|uniref:RNA-binding protein 5-B n=1 Tax=Nibea albiflora TaxID=240163 RepID=A0ACB7F1F3_NIBAL|nr:RNA-binding protein 5-B [Nibea albiflora]
MGYWHRTPTCQPATSASSNTSKEDRIEALPLFSSQLLGDGADGIKANALSCCQHSHSCCSVVTQPVAPDNSTHQYDEASGYYYDPQAGLYYDPSSQYYYNSDTQQYLYWDSQKQTYVLALAESDTSAEQVSNEPRDKKEKPKSKSAQQIAKDMERWAKSLNKEKDSFKDSVQRSAPSTEEDRDESADADAGVSLFEKKKSGMFAAFNGDSDAEEGSSDRAEHEEGENNRLEEDGLPAVSTAAPHQRASVANCEQPTKDGLRSDNIGNKMLQGKGLGRHQQGVTAPISASLRTKGTGLGIKGSSYELSASDTYKDAVRYGHVLTLRWRRVN